MKKLLLSLLGLFLVFALSSAATATTFTDTQDLDRWVSGVGSTSWTHNTPFDLGVPPDTVNSAVLNIEAYFVSGNNDNVSANGTLFGTLHNAEWVWDGFLFGHFEGQDFNVASVFGSWTAGTPFNVSLDYNEVGCINPLFIDVSRLDIDYTNGCAPVPEPGTMLLLGCGLVSLGFIPRRKKE